MKAHRSILIELCRKDYEGEANLIFPALSKAMSTISATARESEKIEIVHRNGDKSYVWVSQQPLEQSLQRLEQGLDVGLNVLQVHTSGPIKARLAELQVMAKAIERKQNREEAINWLLLLGALAAIFWALHLVH